MSAVADITMAGITIIAAGAIIIVIAGNSDGGRLTELGREGRTAFAL
jgi:hypothetical protein